ncbi:MAG: universal stress protein [Pseudomonadota bacterium]
MPETKLILVAIKSPTQRSQPALRKAARLAQATGARLELFHAITSPLYVDAFALEGLSIAEVQKQGKQRTLKALEKHAQRLRDQGLTVAATCDWDFPAYEAVVRRATRSGAGLIVAERHAARHVLPWLLRFNDWELLRRSPVPVLLIKRAQPWTRPVILAAIDPVHAFAKPAGLDVDILDESQTLATALGGKLHAVHAFPNVILPMDTIGLMPADISQRVEKQMEAGVRKTFIKELAGRDIPAARRHLVGGQPAVVVPRVAKKYRAAIVVMGAVSRSGLRRLVIGNVAEQVLDALTCDVLVLKPANFKSKVAKNTRGVQLVATPSYG